MDTVIFVVILGTCLWIALNVNYYNEARGCYNESVSLYIRSRNIGQWEWMKRFIFYFPALIYDKIANRGEL